jgi:hypothetical protein
MTEREIRIVYKLALMIHKHPWFKMKKRTKKDVKLWIATQLATIDVFSIAVKEGIFLVTEEEFHKFYTPKEEEK